MRYNQKRFLVLFIIIAVLLIIGLIYFFVSYKNPKNVISKIVATAQAQNQEEFIEDFQVVMQINPDNSITVQEEIIYNFGDMQSHGIYREIPYKYKARGGNFTVGLDVKSVTNDNGLPLAYQVSRGSGKVNIKIGSANQYVSGSQTYIISYKMDRVVNFFDDQDELYWNVTGNEWPVPIDRSGVVIKLPPGAKAEDLQAECFTGIFGSKEQNCQITNVTNSQVGYSVFNILAPGEGLTVVLGWPKGILTPPTIFTQVKWILRDNPLMLLPLISFFIMILLWYLHGRDLGAKRAIVPYYQVPHDLLPAEVGSLIDERVNLKDISSTIIDLAVKGYIKIKEAGKRDWELIKLKEFSGLKVWEKKFVEEIFNSKESVKVSELKNKFYQHLPSLKRDMYQDMVDKKFFPKSPGRVRGLYMIIAWLTVFLGIFVTPFLGGGFNILFLIVSGIIIFSIGQIMPYKTKEGTRVFQDIKGYKMYLAVAEKERIKFHNSPDRARLASQSDAGAGKKPEEFEKHLPYAMALGVEKKWASQFKDIYLQSPSWYEGNFTTFNSLVFINSLNNMNSFAKSVMASRPGKGAAGGSSGFGGGGFSGGGFGGGGGGSW